MNDCRISCWEFEYVYQKMVEKLKEEYEANGQSHQWSDNFTDIIGYPLNENRKGLPNLTRSIAQHPKVVHYLNSLQKNIAKDKRTISGAKIYEYARKIKDGKWEEGLKGIYSKVFFLYLGYEDYEHFQKGTHQQGEFKGYYYSLNRRRIDDFDLEITVINDKATAKLNGFHDFDRITPLVGNMLQFNQCWLARLASADFIVELKLHISDLGRSPERLLEVNQLFGLISGVGSEQNLLSAECIFVRKGHEHNLTDLKRYLNLRRNHYKISINQNNLLFDEHLIFDALKIDKLEHFAGKTFRLLTLSPDGSIFQSKFKIDADYSSEFWIPETKGPFSCRLSPDNFDNGTLIMTVYTWKNTIYSMVAIDLRPIGKQDKTYKGAFCVAEEGKGSYPFGNRLIMQEETEPFDVIKVQKSERAHMFNTPKLQKLVEELLQFSSR